MPVLLTTLLLFALLATAHGQAINLAKFQDTTASSTASGLRPEEATDGIVSNESRWYSVADSNNDEWLRIDLAESFTIGSAHIYTGLDASYPIPDFTLQYANGSGWQTIQTFTANTATDLNLIFPSPVLANKLRLRTTTTDVIRVKEIALFPPNGGAGYPLGTGVNLNLGSLRRPTVSTTGTYSGVTYHPQYGVDGYVDNSSRWLGTNVSGAEDSFEANFTGTHKVGSIHLHSGYGGTGWLTDFKLEYWGGSWQPVPIAGVSVGTFTNPSLELAVTPDAFHYGSHFTNTAGTILLEEGNRSLYQATLGRFAADAGGRLGIAIDDLPPGGIQVRTWFDGLGHRTTTSPPPFSATSVGRIGNAVTLEWESYANFTYDIVATTDLTGGFPIIIATGITPTGLQTSHNFPLPPSLVNEPRAFFRIIAR